MLSIGFCRVSMGVHRMFVGVHMLSMGHIQTPYGHLPGIIWKTTNPLLTATGTMWTPNYTIGWRNMWRERSIWPMVYMSVHMVSVGVHRVSVYVNRVSIRYH